MAKKEILKALLPHHIQARLQEREETGFGDSAEATDYMLNLQGMLESGNLMKWAQITDQNYGTDTATKLVDAIDAFNNFWEEMNKAE